MAEAVPFRLSLTGDTADYHQFQGYDGYMALAGFAWTLSLVANYADTGKIRQRGDFTGRHAVRATAPAEGSVLVDFMVWMEHNPNVVFGAAAVGPVARFVTGLVDHVISRNLGQDNKPTDDATAAVTARHSGDVEALVAIAEAPIRQAHGIIGNGATEMSISGGFNIINTFNERTKEYVNLNVEDNDPQEAIVSVSAFNANSGYGSVFDSSIGRVVPFTMLRETLRTYSRVFSWGLDQYVNRTGAKIKIQFTRILAMDGRPKRYVILGASPA